MLIYVVIATLLLSVVWILLQAVYMNQASEVYSLFECGFESRADKISYSLQFFTLALSFIAFDFEIFLLLPFIGLFYQTYKNSIILIVIVALLTTLLWLEIKYIYILEEW